MKVRVALPALLCTRACVRAAAQGAGPMERGAGGTWRPEVCRKPHRLRSAAADSGLARRQTVAR